MIPRRKIRSRSLAPVEVGISPRFSNTCCIAVGRSRGTQTGRSETHTHMEANMSSVTGLCTHNHVLTDTHTHTHTHTHAHTSTV